MSEYGTKEWNNDHFPADQLDSTGDTWGQRWQGLDKMRHRSYLKLINNELQGTHTLKVLDIGCALCDFTEKAWKLNPNNRFWGMDVSDNAIAWSRENFPEFDFDVSAIPDIPFIIEFDVVLCLQVICYVNADERKKTIENIHSALVPSGILMFSAGFYGGLQHHTEKEVIGLLQTNFEIHQIVYNHWSLYRKLIRDPLDRVRGAVISLLRVLELSNDEFQDSQWKDGGGFKSITVRALRMGNPISQWLLRAVSLSAKLILGWWYLAQMFNWFSKATLGSKKADEIVILAVKK